MSIFSQVAFLSEKTFILQVANNFIFSNVHRKVLMSLYMIKWSRGEKVSYPNLDFEKEYEYIACGSIISLPSLKDRHNCNFVCQMVFTLFIFSTIYLFLVMSRFS